MSRMGTSKCHTRSIRSNSAFAMSCPAKTTVAFPEWLPFKEQEDSAGEAIVGVSEELQHCRQYPRDMKSSQNRTKTSANIYFKAQGLRV